MIPWKVTVSDKNLKLNLCNNFCMPEPWTLISSGRLYNIFSWICNISNSVRLKNWTGLSNLFSHSPHFSWWQVHRFICCVQSLGHPWFSSFSLILHSHWLCLQNIPRIWPPLSTLVQAMIPSMSVSSFTNCSLNRSYSSKTLLRTLQWFSLCCSE